MDELTLSNDIFHWDKHNKNKDGEVIVAEEKEGRCMFECIKQ